MGLPADELELQIDEVMDVDEWARYAALMGLCGIGDTYILGGLQHNIRFFIPEDGRGVTALPWDMDFVFSESASSVLRPPTAGNIRKVFSIPRVERLYWGHVNDLINTTFHEDYMTPWLQHYGSVVGQSFSSQSSYIRSRRAAVARRLPADVPFKVTTNDGGPLEVSTPVAQIEGEGWIDIRGFRIAGEAEPLQTRWLDDVKWQVTIPLLPGSNSISLEAFDFQGDTSIHTP
ncbi:MAG: CotH kinase family protein [Verrucomicrobiales bacterium]